jgi:endogenous inhibitor of DNA gyrase (YacG/DUF329 family)
MSVNSHSGTLHLTCPGCKRPFSRFRSKRKRVNFCSHKCYQLTLRNLMAKFYDDLSRQPESVAA